MPGREPRDKGHPLLDLPPEMLRIIPETEINTQAVKTRPIAGQTSNLFYFPFPFPSTTLLYPTLSLVIK